MKSGNSQLNKHIPELDGLRGIAILLVICYHYFPYIRIFSIGWIGVDLFFVLSGYLITLRLISTVHERDYFVRFYRNRILRIFPLYFAVLIVFFTGIYFFVKKENLPLLDLYTTHWKSFFIFTENWTFIFYKLPHDSYLAHFWSLAVEEQFYLIWPFMIYFMTSGMKRLGFWILAIVLVIILRFIIYAHHQEFYGWPSYYFNTFCRIDSLIIGAVLCQLRIYRIEVPDKWLTRIFVFFLCTIIISIIWLKNCKLSNPFMGTVGYTFIAICFACIIKMSIDKKKYISGILKLPFLRFCGKISYGLYVFHWPILLMLGARLNNIISAHFQIDAELTGLMSACIVIPISFGVSYLSFRYFESYFLRFKQ